MNQVSADKFLFQWRWKLKVYSVVDERRADEIIRARAVAGDQQSAFIPIFLDCPDFTTDERFDFTEDALRDALKFIDIAATISAVTLTTYSQCLNSPGALTWATVPRYNNAGLYDPRSCPCAARCVACRRDNVTASTLKGMIAHTRALAFAGTPAACRWKPSTSATL